ncbi:MAG: VRR-NUC domain-containing protein [Clostridia bacterium]|nr:VRR-NUC domain-containing protein [Clostridia bacterium]MBQ3462110.1 VRR-NUC domain-containing protein [Clostridia bacterium]MBQ3472246.1 VRR-NUC domain-containing protein [Clostridia bacterium]MBR0470975.1 VRR-NUC domain-containing protein [Clostridia bacterium]
MAQEKNFENRVKKWLRDNGCYVVKFYGCGHTRAGVPDLIICVNGKFVAVEIKAEYGKASQLQLSHLRQVEQAGGHTFILRPSNFIEFKQYITDVMNEC